MEVLREAHSCGTVVAVVVQGYKVGNVKCIEGCMEMTFLESCTSVICGHSVEIYGRHSSKKLLMY